MADENKLVPHEEGSNGHVELVPLPNRFASFDLSPREPHLYDYLLILRKHQWLILSFMLAVVTIVSIATFRMQPVYVATARIEIDRENANILPFQGGDSFDYMVDSENYIETQAKILTSETLALQTIRNNGLALRPEFAAYCKANRLPSATDPEPVHRRADMTLCLSDLVVCGELFNTAHYAVHGWIQPALANSASQVTSRPMMSMVLSCAASRRTSCRRWLSDAAGRIW